MPVWWWRVTNILLDVLNARAGCRRKEAFVYVCTDEGVRAVGRAGKRRLDIAHPKAVCGADVKDCSGMGGEVEGWEDECAGCSLLEAEMEDGEAADVATGVFCFEVPFW